MCLTGNAHPHWEGGCASPGMGMCLTGNSHPHRNCTSSPGMHILTGNSYSHRECTYTILQNKRMRRCGVPPPPIIFERLKLPQQIIYRRKENLSESPNHQKYWANILVSRFYEQFSRNRRNLGHFRKFEKISNS